MYTLSPIDWLKAALCGAVALWLGWRWLRGQRGGAPSGPERARDGWIVLLCLLAGFGWWASSSAGQKRVINDWDLFHHYLGAKYFPELGYTGLYDCVVVADVDAGHTATLARRNVRNLRTNRLQSALAPASDPKRCTDRFSAGRWQAFQADVAYFRGSMTPRRWERVLLDHGYNASPVWGLYGRILASLAPASAAQIWLLAALDPLLLLAMWTVVLRAFGWRVTLLAVVFWATFYPGRFAWISGSYLRQDWLALAVIGVALVRLGRPLGAGLCLGTAALSRIFPALLLAGPLLQFGWSVVRRRPERAPAGWKRLGLGLALAGLLWLPASLVWGGGSSAWIGFVRNLQRHTDTPATNTIGLKTVAAYSRATRTARLKDGRQRDAYRTWRTARTRVYQARRPVVWLLMGAFALLLGWAVQGQPLWRSLALSAAVIPFSGELACYYYAIWLLFCLILRRYPGLVALLFGLSALSWILVAAAPFEDDHYTWISALVLLYGAAVCLVVAGDDEKSEVKTEV